MRKAIKLRVVLWIEGEDEPAHNFAKSTQDAVREMIATGCQRHPELKVTIKSISEGSGGGIKDAPENANDPSPTPGSAGAKP